MRLITFPGQGTPIAISVLKNVIKYKSKEFQQILDKNDHSKYLLEYIFNNPTNPGSIAVCSNLYYQLYEKDRENNKLPSLITEDRNKDVLLLGHSLGELTCLSLNNLFSLKDLFDIANYRNKLMIEKTENYLIAHKLNYSTKFEMWALSSASAVNLPSEVLQLLSRKHSINSPYKSVAIANTNSVKQCVVTGLIEDLESLRADLHLNIPRLRITELTNPDNLAFHNKNVLRPIQEPLYDFIWSILKHNNTHTRTQLDYPILSNYDARISIYIHHAIERFVKSSSNTVQFTKCYDTINSLINETNLHKDDDTAQLKENTLLPDHLAICMGPGNVIYNLIKRNCEQIVPYQYNSTETISALNIVQAKVAEEQPKNK
ncbi:hypothetical protein TPHA_0G01780 [Tetrapisispora phaffii CBS 4417]|uniref:[acyl-carrier-protein] S-malonyltransferase n=1 Tax=Tetrapisispora phaffii (strain ATCC 24235 / CBS 4417 / NBRC 1672 / NRRL Y-8282 / UCD 70-5) TaxID=1071381 RepID=G8BVT6_TETPH|nr:hypothetical protein TPHA_0G01780 [Tetrapisispora phaffii CBS 4417]CCE64014.1 hypothetical protein TPHA_0G01780 [Tetrapisispora phaffii CBS 4417]